MQGYEITKLDLLQLLEVASMKNIVKVTIDNLNYLLIFTGFFVPFKYHNLFFTIPWL